MLRCSLCDTWLFISDFFLEKSPGGSAVAILDYVCTDGYFQCLYISQGLNMQMHAGFDVISIYIFVWENKLRRWKSKLSTRIHGAKVAQSVLV